MMYHGRGVPVTMRKQPSPTPTATPTATASLSPPGPDRAARDLLGFQGHRDERRFGHRGGKPDGCGENVDEPVIAPVYAAYQALISNSFGPGELARHRLSDGEERLFQAYKKEGQTQKDEHNPHCHPAGVRQFASQDYKLEKDQDSDYGSHVYESGPDRCPECVEEFQFQVTMP